MEAKIERADTPDVSLYVGEEDALFQLTWLLQEEISVAKHC